MSEKNVIDPDTWDEFFAEFSTRNLGRRARFELFSQGGDFREEEQEGYFISASIDQNVVTIDRKYTEQEDEKEMRDEIKDVHGVAVQPDTDGTDNTLELTDRNGNMTVLHFESTVDGDS